MSFKQANIYLLMLLNKRVCLQFSFIWAPEDAQCITQHWRDVICCKYFARFDLLQSHPRRSFALGLVLSSPLEGGRSQVVRLPRWFIYNTFLGSTKNEILYFVTFFFFQHIIVWLGSGNLFSHLFFRTSHLKSFSKQETQKKLCWIALEKLQLLGFKMFP